MLADPTIGGRIDKKADDGRRRESMQDISGKMPDD
jgi:hypothetical protein